MTRSSRWRGGVRLVKLAVLLTAAEIHGWWSRPRTLEERARWRQRWCRIVLRGVGLRAETAGRVPERGLLVCNHLSYLDVLVLGALLPAVFVSKAEIRAWPLIGRLCARGGTIFLERERARDAVRANRAVAEALRLGLPVVIFPEGTTTDGLAPLPFHPALFHPAIVAHAPVWPLALSYWFGDGGGASAEAAYFGEITFAAHLLRFTRLRGVRALVQAAPAAIEAGNRTHAALASWREVSSLLHMAPAVARTWSEASGAVREHVRDEMVAF